MSRSRLRRPTLGLVFSLLALAGASTTGQSGFPDFSRIVVVGDSLSAGYQNGSLLASQQVHGYASVVAAQADVPLYLPLIAPPGIPNVLFLIDPGPPPIIGQVPGTSPGRIDPFLQATNLAVPGARVQDALSRRPDLPIDSLTDLVLGLPGLLGGLAFSQVEWAERLAPTTSVLWIGNNDALGAALVADPAVITPLPLFELAYAETIARLASTGATLVVANIPDVTAIAFLTPAQTVAAIVGLPLAVIGPILGIAAGDFVTPDAFELIPLILGGLIPGPLPGNVVLTASEAQIARAAVNAFNAFIARQAESYGAALVDIHGLLEAIRGDGTVVAGRRLTLAFLGGIFSLDGVHPTRTGYAIVANEFIDAFNARFGAGLRKVSVKRVMLEDPLVPPFDGPVATAAAMGRAGAESVRRALMPSR